MIDPIRLISRTSAQAKFWLLSPILMVAIAAPVQAQPYPDEGPANSGMMQPDDQGGEVAALQRRLADLGYYSGPVTGQFDPATQAAVTQFQQSNGLAADGIVGAATSSALYQTGSTPAAGVPTESSSPYLQSNAGGSDVSNLQQQLTQLGYYTGPATGTFDEQTQAAVMSFQRDRGLAVDGIVGQATQAALYQTPAQPNSTPAINPATTPATTPEGQPATTTPAYTPTTTPDDGLLQLGDVGSEVSELQTHLQALGYYDGPISGSFGSQTQSALIAFQQAQGLTADGIAGPRVSAALSTIAPATTQTAAVTVPQATTQPAIQPASQPTSTAVTVPQAIPAQPLTQPVTQPTAATVQVPSLAPSIPASDPAGNQSALPPTNALPPGNPANGPFSNEGGRFGVMELQRRLQLRGFDPVEMTGVYDSETQNAINQAQAAYGLSQGDLFEHY